MIAPTPHRTRYSTRCTRPHGNSQELEHDCQATRARTKLPPRSLSEKGRGDTGGDSMNQDRLTASFQPYVLSLFRFITGLLLFQYGVAKLFKFPPGTMFDKVELFSLIGAEGTLELVLGGPLMI